MEARLLKSLLAVYVGLFLLFLYGPFIVLGILSFQKGPEGGPQFPIERMVDFLVPAPPRSRAAFARRAAADRRCPRALVDSGGHDDGRLHRPRRHVGAGLPAQLPRPQPRLLSHRARHDRSRRARRPRLGAGRYNHSASTGTGGARPS